MIFAFLDGRQIHVTVNVEPPMKQGQTRYHYMVLIFKVRKKLYHFETSINIIQLILDINMI